MENLVGPLIPKEIDDPSTGSGDNKTDDPSFIPMKRISNGSVTFMMGSPGDEPGRNSNETQHQVTLTQGFYMAIYPVTQEQYEAVMGNNPSIFTSGADAGEAQGKRPVEQVSWYDTLVFCNKLSMEEGLTPAYQISGSTDPTAWGTVPATYNATWNAVTIVPGSTGYRLPTEAQWEYACRAGTTTAWHTGDTADAALQAAAWYTGVHAGNANDKTHEVGKKSANAWGLYDMHGNVSEFCWDWYDVYSAGAQTDPEGPVAGTYRVMRGGSWWSASAQDLRSACRDLFSPYIKSYVVGFRVVRP